jgi:hypothetical protein
MTDAPSSGTTATVDALDVATTQMASGLAIGFDVTLPVNDTLGAGSTAIVEPSLLASATSNRARAGLEGSASMDSTGSICCTTTVEDAVDARTPPTEQTIAMEAAAP